MPPLTINCGNYYIDRMSGKYRVRVLTTANEMDHRDTRLLVIYEDSAGNRSARGFDNFNENYKECAE